MLSTFIDITERKLAERRLATQHAVSRVLAEATSLEQAVPRILEAVCVGEDWDVGTVWVRDARAELMRCVDVWHRRDRTDLGELVSLTRSLVFARGSGVLGRVWLTGQPQLVVDLARECDVPRGPVAVRAGFSHAVAAPIRHGDELIGVIDFLGNDDADPQQRELLDTVGRQIGLYIDRARAAAAVRRSEERLLSVIEHLSEGLVLANRQGEYLHWNPAALAIFGVSSDEVARGPLQKIQARYELKTLEGQPVPMEARPVERVFRGEMLRDYELDVRRVDSDWHRILSYGGSRVSQPDGTELAIITINDVTERVRRDELRRMSEQLVEDNLRIREASRLKSEFLANMSHELRTPLNAIIGFVSLIHRGKAGTVSNEQREYLGDVLASARHLLQLINDVLDLSKVESGTIQLTLEELETEHVVREVSDVVRGLAAAKNLQIVTEIDAALSRITGDARTIKQMLYNYLSNAIKFTPAGGRIWIRIVPEDASSYRIDVEDTGIGVAEQDLSRLFVEFQQLDSSAAKKYQGTGLGLAKRFAEAHGGYAGAVSELGRGSRFFVILPRVARVAPRA